MELRSHFNGQLNLNKKPKQKSIKTAPYGWCLVDGKLHKDPREQSTLKLILKWAKQGQSHCAIARRLNEQNLKPRHATKWSQPTVGFIIKRHQEQESNGPSDHNGSEAGCPEDIHGAGSVMEETNE